MAKYILCEWEQNGYNDSDFVCMYYDAEKKEIVSYTYGTTRCAAPTAYAIDGNKTTIYISKMNPTTFQWETDKEPLLVPTKEIVEEARQVYEEKILQALIEGDKRHVDSPEVGDLKEGLTLELVEECKNQVFKQDKCQKCNGSGHWINPRNSNDKRNCFACKGSGNCKGEKEKNAQGKQVYEKVPAGTVGTIVDWKSFGTFYAKGYNQPDRHNTTVVLKTAQGKLFRAPLDKCKLARAYASVEVLREKAKSLSYDYQWQSLGPHCAWLSSNVAEDIAKS